jgi:peptide deformylase
MQLLEIRKYPDSILRKNSESISEITPKELKLFEDMLLTMHHFKGIGLAAPQIGELLQLIVADTGEGIIKLANPKIIKRRGKDKMTEGCLSIPDFSIDIVRSYEVVVLGLNEEGEQIEIKAKGLLARVLQHEIDHLKGKLILDYRRLWDKIFKKYPIKRG